MKQFSTIMFFLLLFSTSPVQAASKWSVLLNTLEQQVGIPYHFGGEDPDRGFDCSGLIKYAYAKIGKKLPHSTQQLKQMGTKIPLSKLRRGDLIFFSPGARASHVGVYLGHGVVVHAPSTGKNVTVMDVFHHIYWKKTIAFARRILPSL